MENSYLSGFGVFGPCGRVSPRLKRDALRLDDMMFLNSKHLKSVCRYSENYVCSYDAGLPNKAKVTCACASSRNWQIIFEVSSNFL